MTIVQSDQRVTRVDYHTFTTERLKPETDGVFWSVFFVSDVDERYTCRSRETGHVFGNRGNKFSLAKLPGTCLWTVAGERAIVGLARAPSLARGLRARIQLCHVWFGLVQLCHVIVLNIMTRASAIITRVWRRYVGV